MKAAEAEQYEQERRAEAQRALAEASAYAKMKEAEGIRAVGLAEAEAIEKKAEAQKKMGEASVLKCTRPRCPRLSGMLPRRLPGRIRLSCTVTATPPSWSRML